MASSERKRRDPHPTYARARRKRLAQESARKGKGRRVIGKLEGNPAVVRGAIVAVLGLLTTAGVGWAADVPDDVITSVAVLVAFVGPLVAALLIRPTVTPNPKVVARVTTDGTVVAGDAAVAPTGRELPLDRLDQLEPVAVRPTLLVDP